VGKVLWLIKNEGREEAGEEEFRIYVIRIRGYYRETGVSEIMRGGVPPLYLPPHPPLERRGRGGIGRFIPSGDLLLVKDEDTEKAGTD